MIIFVRHGETALNRDARLQGRLDAPLTERGRAQAALLASTLTESGAVRVLASPLERAQATAMVIATRLGLAVETEDALVEIDYGDWDGLPLAEVREVAPNAWRTDPDFTPPGGESLIDVTRRASALLARHRAAGAPVTIAVSHVTPIKSAVLAAVAGDPLLAWRMHLDVASITRVGYRDTGHYLASFNETMHLVG